MQIEQANKAPLVYTPSPCFVCGSDATKFVLRLDAVPIDTNRLWQSKETAKQAPCAPICLHFCTGCGHLYNAAFNDDLVTYEVNYENSQMFSPLFRSYAIALARRLAEQYDLHGKDVVEIGGGRGDFLTLLCEEAGCRGVSFCPSFAPGPDDALSPNIRFVKDYYTKAYARTPADLIVCRHVLEHFESPRALVESVRAATLHQPNASVYFEVPNGEEIIRNSLLHELIYQHPSYFTRASLRHLFRVCGFELVHFREDFERQFLAVEARPASTEANVVSLEAPQDDADLFEAVRAFGNAYSSQKTRWEALFARVRGRRTLLWGAGAKAVTFLNAFGLDADAIEAVVDVNPRKLGSYLPGSGHEIISPWAAIANPPETVIVANPVYLNEIQEMMKPAKTTVEYIVM